MKKTCIMIYGRFNPVHIGHIEIFKRGLYYNNTIENSDLKLYVSHTVDKKNNPLPYNLKIEMISEYFPEIVPFIQMNDTNNLINKLEVINEEYDNLIMLCGSDRQFVFESVIMNYNGILYNFDSIQIVNMGERETSPYSSTYMRQCVASGNYQGFCSCLPSSSEDLSIKYFNLLSMFMGKHNVIQN